ncbi:MAG: hypothetical protein II344_04760 [Bacteroidales bacterium]|nr:hypothetical protein [Bacteroidales bacterium]
METPKLNKLISCLDKESKLLKVLEKYDLDTLVVDNKFRKLSAMDLEILDMELKQIYVDWQYEIESIKDITPLDIVIELQRLCAGIDDLQKVKEFFKKRFAVITFPKVIEMFDLDLICLGYNDGEIRGKSYMAVKDMTEDISFWKDEGYRDVIRLLVGEELRSQSVDEVKRYDRDKIEPMELSAKVFTDRAIKYFEIAEQRGWIVKKPSGLYRHNFDKGVKFAYFVKRVYKPEEAEWTEIPQKEIELLFGVKRLDGDLRNLEEVKKPQQWRKEIDEIFID